MMRRVSRRNPVWSNVIIERYWTAVGRHVGPALLPLRNDAGGVQKVHELGVGSYGVVMATETPGVVCKLTRDASEAAFVTRAMQIGEWPDGITRYSHAVTLPTRPLAYLLWREEAATVNKVPRYVQGYLNAIDAALIDTPAYFSGSRATARRATVATTVPRYVGRVSLSEVATLHAIERAQAARRGPARVAWSLAAARLLAEHLARDERVGSLGEAIWFYQQHAIYLRDFHDANLGRVARYDEAAWCVRDPGGAVFLRPQDAALRPPRLTR